MTTLITGANGQLGSELKKIWLSPKQFYFTDYEELDITDREAVERFVCNNRVDIIVNCAAYTAVDKAQDEELSAFRINSKGVTAIADAALASWRAGVSGKGGPLIIHISTDYVFDGKAKRAYNEESAVQPLSVYGISKLSGEEALRGSICNYFIIRTSWLYSAYGSNFVKTILKLSKEREEINVVADQLGTPTHAGDLAKAIDSIVKVWSGVTESERDNLYGVYHFSNEGVTSWYEFAKYIVEKSGSNCKVNPITSDQYLTKAPRPQYSVLDTTKIKKKFGINIRNWQEPLLELINSGEI